MSNFAAQTKAIITRLQELGIAPKMAERASLGPYSIVNIFNERPEEMIANSATTGFSKQEDLAAFKALIEWSERRAFEYAVASKKLTPLTSSDGVAAYPVGQSDAKRCARDNALSEAIERYAWATWWDNASVAFDLTQAEYFSESEVELLELASELAPIEQTCRIEPKIANPHGRRVFIYLARLSTGGVISGGACGLIEESEQMSERALGELLRHAHVAAHLSEGYQPQSFYEKRLAFFLTEAGESLVDDRLSQTGKDAIVLPELEVDEELQYPANDVVYVHRCLFKNQPAFVGGNLQRFCL